MKLHLLFYQSILGEGNLVSVFNDIKAEVLEKRSKGGVWWIVGKLSQNALKIERAIAWWPGKSDLAFGAFTATVLSFGRLVRCNNRYLGSRGDEYHVAIHSIGLFKKIKKWLTRQTDKTRQAVIVSLKEVNGIYTVMWCLVAMVFSLRWA